jgi:hypothetical protein
MAKKRRKHNFSQVQIERFGTDIESLSLHSTEVGVEIRVDPRDPDVKRRVEMLSRYGLVKYRIHANGDKIWRVALTELGAEIAVAHEKRMARSKVTQESRLSATRWVSMSRSSALSTERMTRAGSSRSSYPRMRFSSPPRLFDPSSRRQSKKTSPAS